MQNKWDCHFSAKDIRIWGYFYALSKYSQFFVNSLKNKK